MSTTVTEPPALVVSWEVDGRRLDVDLYAITGLEWRAIREVTGLRQADVLAAVLYEKDVCATAAVMWTWLRRDDPKLSYDLVAGSLSMSALVPPPEPEDTA